MTRTREAIGNFLSNRVSHSPYLLPRYTTDLETQIMCSSDGEPGDDPGTYTADGEVWGNKRWPYQAGTDPSYGDPEIKFSPAARVDRVGTTWWDYVNKRSVAVGIDIDSSDGHAETTNTNHKEQIDGIIEKLNGLDYVTIVRSTGGKGIHVYVFFDQSNLPPAKNHHEHTIVARKTLELISQDIGYPLKDHVDCVGSVFWIWAKSSPQGHPGFSLVKEGVPLDSGRLATINLPTPTVRGRSQVDFEVVQLDDRHKEILEAVSAQPYYFNVRSDMNLIHTHTCAIRDAIAGGLKILGTFETNSNGDDPQTPNCFLAPQAKGIFRVYRFGQAQHEPNWEFKGGKNFCTLNDAPSVQEQIVKHAYKKIAGRYHLSTEAIHEIAATMGESLGPNLPKDVWAIFTPTEVTLCAKMEKGPSAEVIRQLKAQGIEPHPEVPEGWSVEGDLLVRVLKPTVEVRTLDDRLLAKSDELYRCIEQGGKPQGWCFKKADGNWSFMDNRTQVEKNAKVRIGTDFYERALTVMSERPWNVEVTPFAPEYPGNRTWNTNAPGLKVEPAESGGDHPHYDMVLEHIGSELDTPVLASEWCRKGNITTGADYLRCWLACLIHHTDQPLPYLFLVGPQNSGKSVFHEMCKYLFSGGTASAGGALVNNHNEELDGCFLVNVEERDLSDKRAGAYAKIKEWVTARELNIHAKYKKPYDTKNYLHFVQTANNTTFLPMEDGDTRVVAIDVPALTKVMPKSVMEKHFEREAPRFLRTLLNTVVPPPVDRLRIPTLKTETKELMERRAMSPLMNFSTDSMFARDGQKIEIGELVSAFKKWAESNNLVTESDFAIMQEINTRSDKFQVGRRGKKMYVVNAALSATSRAKDKPIFVSSSGTF